MNEVTKKKPKKFQLEKLELNLGKIKKKKFILKNQHLQKLRKKCQQKT